ncbi:DNA-binding transcriptional MerR regulator [Sinobacterium caligoides]|uniref:DNA-binding transcriptional MerR regulator n=1 Tax=Sinobacterium caligoides TaxID=933926 RepID=A0A3N2E0J4_9GAMM|nr:MerR family transcriptional regulator [Sinobacterium caligoides]ROS05095.1 DNA-binding transcriptional MerR regulator [Sinobacterium caligoides]
MYIGEAAKRTGLSIKAIRFYEEIGLIRQLERVGRYRLYKEADIEVLLLIKEAKALGVGLSQLQGVIQYNEGQIDWSTIKVFLHGIRQQLTQQIEDVQQKIASLDICYEQIKPS